MRGRFSAQQNGISVFPQSVQFVSTEDSLPAAVVLVTMKATLARTGSRPGWIKQAQWLSVMTFTETVLSRINGRWVGSKQRN